MRRRHAGGYGAAVHAAQVVLGFELRQVPAHGFTGDAEAVGELRHGDFSVDRELLYDQPVSFFGEHFCLRWDS